LKKFGVPPLVAINKFITDTPAEIAAVIEAAASMGVKAFLCEHWGKGGAGIEDLARHVVEVADSGVAKFKPLYPDEMPRRDKVKTIVTEIYRGSDITCDASVENRFKELQEAGFGNLPVCMAKTQYSFSTDPNLRGAPTGHVVPVRELRLSAGAEFIVVITGDIMTMPGFTVTRPGRTMISMPTKPMPTASQSRPSGRAPDSTRMPADLRPAISRSLGHFTLTRPGDRQDSARSAAARAATKDSCAASPAGRSVVISRVAARLPEPVSQARPRRPRPAVWRRAAIQRGPPSPASARRRASALVESSSSKNAIGG